MPLVKIDASRYWYYDFSYGGRRYRGSTHETIKKNAALREAEKLASIQRGDPLTYRGKRAPLLREFLPTYLKTVEDNQLLSASTQRYYRNGARLLKTTPLLDVPLDRITRTVVAGARFPGSGSNANNAIRTLRTALSYAVELGILHRAPALPLHEERVRTQTYSPQQEKAFLAVADQDTADAFLLLMDTGMRPEECCRYEVDWIDWERGLLRVIGGKTRAATREIPMTSRVRAMLVERLKRAAGSVFENHREGHFLFPSRKKGKHLTLRSLRASFNKAKRAANLPAELVLYCTRHTFGTDMAELGNPKLTMVVMGHEELKTTARYQHPQTESVGAFLDNRNAKRKTQPILTGMIAVLVKLLVKLTHRFSSDSAVSD